MKINANTITILENFSKICPAIIVEDGKILKTYSFSRAIRGKAILDQEFPAEFALNNLGKFISILSLFTDPTLEFYENHLIITDGVRSVTYNYTNEKIIYKEQWYNNYFNEVKIDSFPVNFKLLNKDFKILEKAIGILGLPEIAIIGDGNTICVKGTNSKDTSTNQYEINTLIKCQDQFTVYFNPENLRLLPLDYNVSISFDPAVARFHSDNVEYHVAVEHSSTF